MDFDITPLLSQLSKNHGATIALAKFTLTKEQFNLYLIEAEIQAQYSFLEFVETFPKMTKDINETKRIVEGIIEVLKKQREDLISSQE